jgi:hypothetical protein
LSADRLHSNGAKLQMNLNTMHFDKKNLAIILGVISSIFDAFANAGFL